MLYPTGCFSLCCCSSFCLFTVLVRGVTAEVETRHSSYVSTTFVWSSVILYPACVSLVIGNLRSRGGGGWEHSYHLLNFWGCSRLFTCRCINTYVSLDDIDVKSRIPQTMMMFGVYMYACTSCCPLSTRHNTSSLFPGFSSVFEERAWGRG